ncbi:hypothetical protein BU17DRAFT_60052 [Hysterangium stoloniferum]|nr:hypothetical protein BU17DRAFT_60052 [Hysterangium stoloniferum]
MDGRSSIVTRVYGDAFIANSTWLVVATVVVYDYGLTIEYETRYLGIFKVIFDISAAAVLSVQVLVIVLALVVLANLLMMGLHMPVGAAPFRTHRLLFCRWNATKEWYMTGWAVFRIAIGQYICHKLDSVLILSDVTVVDEVFNSS